MAPTNISQQTSTAVPLQAELARTAPQPLSLIHISEPTRPY